MTVRAALQFWTEEMCPHGADSMRPYYETAMEPLSGTEVEHLRRKFADAAVRYASYDVVNDRLVDTELYDDAEEAIQATEIGHVAIVLIPLPD